MPSGSRPLIGSSKMTVSGSPIRAAAMPSRWLMPSEKVPTRLPATSLRPTRSSSSVTRRRSMPLVSANHLKWLAATNGIDRRRVTELLDLVGLSDVAGKRVGTFSLGMSQRLGIAAALIGDPETVIFDEPINGLDPEGILWIRNLMKSLASEGRTVFLSSHLMSEMAQTADHLLVIGRGKIIADASTDEFINRHTAPSVRVRAVQQGDLAEALTQRGALIECGSDGAMVVTGLDSAAIGGAASAHDITLVELAPLGTSLEEAYFDLTKDETDYHAGQLAGSTKGI